VFLRRPVRTGISLRYQAEARRHGAENLLLKRNVIAKEGWERLSLDVMTGIVIVSVLTAVIVYLLR